MSASAGFPWLLPFSLQSEILPDSVLIDKRRSRRAYPLYLSRRPLSIVLIAVCFLPYLSGDSQSETCCQPNVRNPDDIKCREEEQCSLCSGAPMASYRYFYCLSSLDSCSPESLEQMLDICIDAPQ